MFVRYGGKTYEVGGKRVAKLNRQATADGADGEDGPARPREIRMIDALVTDLRFEPEAGRDDGKLRRIAARPRFDDPRVAGKGAMRFELRLRDVDAPVHIDAPASGRPIEEPLRSSGPRSAARETCSPPETTAG